MILAMGNSGFFLLQIIKFTFTSTTFGNEKTFIGNVDIKKAEEDVGTPFGHWVICISHFLCPAVTGFH